MKKISTIKNKFVNPFYSLVLNERTYTLKNNFSDRTVIKWKYNDKIDDSINLLNEISKLLQIDIMYEKKSNFEFVNDLKSSILDNFRSDVDKDVVSKLLLKNLKQFEIKKYNLDLQNKKITTLYSGSHAIKLFSIINDLDDNLNCDEIINICNNSDVVLFEKTYSKKYIIGPFLEKTHLKNKNLELLDNNFKPSVNNFYDNKIILYGINNFIKEQQSFAIIESLSNYLYQSCPLYNRRIFIDDDGFVQVSDILPLF